MQKLGEPHAEPISSGTTKKKRPAAPLKHPTAAKPRNLARHHTPAAASKNAAYSPLAPHPTRASTNKKPSWREHTRLIDAETWEYGR